MDNRAFTYKKKMKFDPYFMPYTKINSKLTIDQNVRVETMKLLKENIGVSLCTHRSDKCFSDMTPKENIECPQN